VGMALLGQDQSRAHCNFDGLKRHCHRSAVRSALQKRAAQKRLETKDDEIQQVVGKSSGSASAADAKPSSRGPRPTWSDSRANARANADERFGILVARDWLPGLGSGHFAKFLTRPQFWLKVGVLFVPSGDEAGRRRSLS